MSSDASAVRIEDPGALRRLATIALLAILLGLLVQILILVVKLVGSIQVPGVVFVVDLAQGVTWSLLVCSGVAIGTSVLRARAALAGALSAIFAPIALAAAKAVQRLVAGMLEVAEQQAVLSLGSVSLMRAVEYGILGFALGTLAQRRERRFRPYFLVGLLLGGAVLALSAFFARQKGPPFGATQLSVGIINEMIFPIGCSIVIYAGQMVGRTFSRTELALE